MLDASPAKSPEPTPVVAEPPTPEKQIWDFFISKGFTREQTAGIVGNFKQEHNYQTSDVPGGLGIAQWMGGRRNKLMAKADYLNLNVQLEFVIEEFSDDEKAAHTALRATNSVEAATIAVQDLYERCNPLKCMQSQRIQYAYDAYNKY